MNQTGQRKLPWLMSALAMLLFLAACTTTAGTSPVETPETAQVPAVAAATATPAAGSVPDASPTPQLEASSNDVAEITILNGDDRPDRLRFATSSWNTNWEVHTVNYDEIISGGPPRDGIPSIDQPQFISLAEAGDWLASNEPVIALDLNGEARAYPLQILIWHEITNDTVGGLPVLVTFCPLCNSAIVFDRRLDGQVLEFGTSGLLRNSDLVMYDRTTESLWQQFTGDAIVGDMVGKRLTFLPSAIISFADFQQAYPEGTVLSRETGFRRDYGRNPYAGYDTIGSNPFLFVGDADGRLPAMARVITVVLADEGIDVAYPLDILQAAGVINDRQGNTDLVVFHKSGTASALGAATIASAEDVGATGVFDPNLEGQKLTFSLSDGQILDDQTGSVWNVVGQAVEGPLAGKQLTPIIHADHFWFSWAAFRPDTVIYSN